MNKLACIYTRFSQRPNAADCLSCETQWERCRAYCTAQSMTVDASFEDRAASGGSTEGRPGLAAALDWVCEHKAALVVYSLSRLARNVKDAMVISERLEKAGADLVSLNERIDTTSAMGRFVFTLMAAVGALEREQIGERTSDAMLAHQRAGRSMSSKPPFGYRFQLADKSLLEKDPHEQHIIYMVKDLLSTGASRRDIMKAIQANNLRFRGKRINSLHISRMMKREGLA